jgi:hypothetical protein
VVGDEDQSIYSFRGAELENILQFSQQFPGTEVVRLEENYRSSRNILEVATRVVEHNRNRLGKTLWSRKGGGAPVVLAQLDTQNEEAQFCADILRDGRFDQSAILYRMNFQSRVFETLFARLGIPFRVVGTVRFYEREEIKDALAYLKLLVNPRDELAFRRAFSKPRRGVGERSIGRITERWTRRGGSLLDAARGTRSKLPAKAAAGIQVLLSVYGGCETMLAQDPPVSLGEVVRRLIEESGLLELYRQRDVGDGTEKVKNLEELVNATAEYTGTAEGLAAFLESLALLQYGPRVAGGGRRPGGGTPAVLRRRHTCPGGAVPDDLSEAADLRDPPGQRALLLYQGDPGRGAARVRPELRRGGPFSPGLRGVPRRIRPRHRHPQVGGGRPEHGVRALRFGQACPFSPEIQPSGEDQP